MIVVMLLKRHSKKTKIATAINKNNHLIVTINGSPNVADIESVHERVKDHIDKCGRDDRPVLIIIDLSGTMTLSISKDLRDALRELFGSIEADALAIVGKPQILLLSSFLMNGHEAMKKGFFRFPAQATRWLSRANEIRPSSNVAAVVGAVLCIIGLAALIGWQTDNLYLTRFIPALRPINPMAAVAVVVIGLGFFAYWREKLQLIRVGGVFIIVLGITTLLRLGTDTLLFGSKVTAEGIHSVLADSAAVCLILLGIIGLVSARPTSRWYKHYVAFEVVAASLVILISLFNIYGQLYAHDFIYGVSGTFVMAFNLAIAFFIAASAIIFLEASKQRGNVLSLVTPIGWLMIIAVLALQVGTYTSWSASNRSLERVSTQQFQSDAEALGKGMQKEITSYEDSLAGFRGLFASSSFVARDEFDTYYHQLGIKEEYPALRSVAFIAAVKDSELKSFVATQQQTSPDLKPTFTIHSLSKGSLHLIATYVPDTTNTSTFGLDLSSVPGRSEIYGTALKTGETHASGSVTFPNNSPIASGSDNYGFFMTIPVKLEGASGYTGLVNANFAYSTFFHNFFASSASKVAGLGIKVTDRDSKETLYTAGDVAQTTHLDQKDVDIADRVWQVHFYGDSAYGIAEQDNQSTQVLLVGQVLSLTILIIFFILSRSRQQALKLAGIATKDLEVERDNILQLHQKDEAILSSIGDGVFAINNDKKIILFNDAAEVLSGYSADEALGKEYTEILKFRSEQNGKVVDGFIKKALQGKKANMENDTELVRKDETVISVADSAAPIIGADKKQQGIIVVFRDVSKERALERAQNEFVSLASHQLRTPATAVKQQLGLIVEGYAKKASDIQRFVKSAYESNEEQLEIVDDLLTTARLETGAIALGKDSIDIGKLIEEIVIEQEPLKKPGQQIKYVLPSESISARIDETKIRMSISNLLSNAIKYTPETGEVAVRLENSDDKILITVEDSGVGIADKDMEKLFVKFSRVENPLSAKVQGTGLGLYLVKQVVQLHHGKVSVESEVGKGSRFIIQLPKE